MPAADSGLLAAIILAAGVTAVVAIGMMVVRQYRTSQLTASRGVLSGALGVGVLALSALSVVALSPVSAQAVVPASSTTSVVDVQLPTK